ncbi:hypothetical protein EDD11_010173 [Mortierella claussenii]|nr:hypothetical protein EDD11_010173 [Mortierella claussenii]
MRLRIRHSEGIVTLTQLIPQSTLLELQNEIAKEIKAPVDRLELKFGYPPKLLAINNTNVHTSLESLGIKDGEQILTSERSEGSLSTYNFGQTLSIPLTTSMTPAAHTSSSAALASTSVSHTSSSAFSAAGSVEGGAFGSRPVVHPTSAQTAFHARDNAASNTFSGVLTVDSAYKPAAFPAAAATTQDGVNSILIRDQGLLVVREVADDNSCLFNAIAYTLDPAMQNNVKGLRQIVAQAIEANPDTYPDVVLGRSRKDYCDWIRKENSWGGAIELAIFSDHYKTGMAHVLTHATERMQDGAYYDAVALTPSVDIPADCDQTRFDTHFEDVITAGIQLAAKLKKAHKFTDLATFTLRCSVCHVGLKGEKDAHQHAQQTKHTAL